MNESLRNRETKHFNDSLWTYIRTYGHMVYVYALFQA